MIVENNSQNKMSRSRAFLIHLAISLGVLAVALVIILGSWYPGQFILAGGLEGLAILAGVTLVLGPVLTLVIFNPGKKKVLIKLDLVLIALIQISSIGFGLWIIYQERPLLQVLADDGVHVISASELAVYGMDVSALHLPDSPPHNVVLDIPITDLSGLNQLKLIHQLVNKKPIILSEEIYIHGSDFDPGELGKRISFILKTLPNSSRNQIASLEKRPDCSWIPLISIHTSGIGCYNRELGLIEITRK